MKTISSLITKLADLKPALCIAATLIVPLTASAWAGGDGQDADRGRDRDGRESGNRKHHDDQAEVVRPNERYHGRTYAEWSTESLKWALELPAEGHPGLDLSPDFDASAGQSGNVWFLGAPLDVVERTCTIPKNKALFITLVNVEASTLEPAPFFGADPVQQAIQAKFFADHIVPASLICTIDGVPVRHLERYRVVSDPFDFTAPSPWIFGDIGGDGSAAGEGYYVLIKPLAKGQHTIHFEASFHFETDEVPEWAPHPPLDFGLDMTYQLTVK